MTVYYLDSSALVKRYAAEPGSPWIQSIVATGPRGTIFTSIATQVEVVAAIVRRTRSQQIVPEQARAALSALKRDFATRYSVVLLGESVAERAVALCERHGLRGYDGIQLASALMVQDELSAAGLSSLVFVSADHELNKAAQEESLAVDNPNDHR